MALKRDSTRLKELIINPLNETILTVIEICEGDSTLMFGICCSTAVLSREMNLFNRESWNNKQGIIE